MKNKILALAFLFVAAPVFAQTPVVPVNQYISADDVASALLIKYIGTGSSAAVASTSTANLTFLLAGSAVTSFECPVAGALGGIIDVTNAACNTLGEVVDIINASADWRAVIVDGLRTDTSALLLTVGSTQATVAKGVRIPQDTSANFAVGETRAMIPAGCRADIRCFLTPAGKLIENPAGGTQTFLNYLIGYSTYGGGGSVLNIYSVKSSNKAAGAEVVTQLWSEAMGATTVAKSFTQFENVPLVSLPHEKMVVRISNDTAQTVVNMVAAGHRVSVN